MSDYDYDCEPDYSAEEDAIFESDYSPSRKNRFTCSDGFCGASDCSRCGGGDDVDEDTEEEE